LESGQLTALVGPSGCGKSCIVNLVAGYEKPDSGSVLLNGKPITGAGKDRMVVFQETALFPWLTTYQNVVFGPKLRGDIVGPKLRERAIDILKTVGLTEFKDKYPAQLSGGMQRRAELARAMINDPLLMIMDEPFRGLDAMTRELMQEFFLRLFEKNRRTNLFVTSEIEEAIFLADKLVVLSSRPATVRSVITIDLPRPRDFHMLNSPEAYDYKREALEILYEEAMKDFGRTSQSDFLEAFARRVAD
jgi:NitT/TauT family transport system ATP-binding protein